MAASSPLAREVEAPEARAKLMVMSGVLLHEIGHQRHQPARAECGQDGQIERARMPIAHNCNGGFAQLRQRRTHRLGIGFALRRQLDVGGCRALNSERPICASICVDLPADGTLGQSSSRAAAVKLPSRDTRSKAASAPVDGSRRRWTLMIHS